MVEVINKSVFKGIAGKRSGKPKGVIIHNDAGSKNATAKWYINNFLPGRYNANQSELGFAHYYIDRHTIARSEDTYNKAWHAGNKDGNANYIGYEVCQSIGESKENFVANEEMTFRQVAEDLQFYGLPANRDTIKLHKQFTSTSCPHRSVELHGDWNAVQDYFIARVKHYMSLGKTVAEMLKKGGETVDVVIPATKPSSNANVSGKSIDQLAREVIQGVHGNGKERKSSLGSKYDAVQNRVEEILKADEPAATSIGKGSKVTTPTLFTTSSSTKNVRTSPIAGIVDTINNSWKNQVRLKDSSGNYIGFTRLADIGAKSTASAVATPKSTSKKYSLPNAEYWVKSPQFNGSGVRAVQEALASIYYYPDKGAKNNGVDGYYGPKSADAVKRFQSMYGLKADGVYGAATRKKLDSLVN